MYFLNRFSADRRVESQSDMYIELLGYFPYLLCKAWNILIVETRKIKRIVYHCAIQRRSRDTAESLEGLT